MSTPSLDLVAVGNALVDHIHRVTVLPEPDSSAFVLDRRVAPGGVEGNVVAAAAKLGLRVGIIARVGADADGEMVLRDFRERGVDVTRVQIGDEGETAYSLIFVDNHGERIIMTGGVGVRRLTLDDADAAYIRRARVCFTSGYLPWPLLEWVVRLRTERRSPALAFDLPDGFADLEARGLRRTHVDAVLASIDLFMTNRIGLASYTGEATIEFGVARLWSKGVRRAAVSNGNHGVHLLDADGNRPELFHVPAFPSRVVDTSGAGDVLHAALIADWLLTGRQAVVAGRFAAAAAALACRGWGVRSALPSRAEAAALADQNQGGHDMRA